MRLFHQDEKLCPEEVGRLIDFGLSGDSDYDSMARLQLEGVAALYNILCENKFAYLADEVGMGKTYQALGLAAVLWHLKPDARVVFVSPRQALQQKWKRDYQNFFSGNYLRHRLGNGGHARGDDRVTSVVLGTPLHRPAFHHRLSEWAMALSRQEKSAVFLRHSSFRRPLFVTRDEASDIPGAWTRWKERMAGWGLHDSAVEVKGAKEDNMSFLFNCEMGCALNKRLRELAADGQAIDLLVVDEAQCLRNPENQSNTVFRKVFEDVVDKWLFLSATPVHGGPEDLRNVLNGYPQACKVITEQDVESMEKLQRRLRRFMVRRPRRYLCGQAQATATTVGKGDYRDHDRDGWAVTELDAASTLSMALVQKHLTRILAGRSNRYHIGFLSSFETLQDSVRRLEDCHDEPDGDRDSDWVLDPNERGVRSLERQAPDAGTLARLAQSYASRFGRPLPHPKLDEVVQKAGRLAFGTETEPGGEKYLIFTRRVSTVAALRERLEAYHQKTVEDRAQRVWGETLEWNGPDDMGDSPDADDEVEEFVEQTPDDDGTPFRTAMAKKGWLFNFLRRFRRTGGDALFFEENWLQRLLAWEGRSAEDAAKRIPDRLWAESLAYARRSAGVKTAVHRAKQLHYLSVHAPIRCPEAFNLTPEDGATWHSMLTRLLPAAVDVPAAESVEAELARGPDSVRYPRILDHTTLWSKWDDILSLHDLCLPGSERLPSWQDLCRRQVLKTVFGQVFRLTDIVIDLFFANRTDGPFVDSFLQYVAGTDPSAMRLRGMCKDWLEHLDLIVRNTFSHSGRDLEGLARLGSFVELNKQSPVLGVTGSSKGHKTALSQFRMPGYPTVLVCTDTLKEGVDLHLFCDKVVHYGVAWTSGDLEQRIGRVDRYFSQIERRLRNAPAGSMPQLRVYYPHVVRSLERGQVEYVIERKRQAEALMDTTLALDETDSKEIVLDATTTSLRRPPSSSLDQPFGTPSFDGHQASLDVVSEAALRSRMTHYSSFSSALHKRLLEAGVAVRDNDRGLHQGFTFSLPSYGAGRALWRFDVDLDRYVISFVGAPKLDAPFLPGCEHVQVEREVRAEPVWQMVVPGPGDPPSGALLDSVADLLTAPAVASPQVRAWWAVASTAQRLGTSEPNSLPHTLTVRIPLGSRHQTVKIRLSHNLFRVTSQICTLATLPESDRWGGLPSASAITAWTVLENRQLSSGFLVLDPSGGLHYGLQLITVDPSPEILSSVILTAARRADDYEAALVGDDVY